MWRRKRFQTKTLKASGFRKRSKSTVFRKLFRFLPFLLVLPVIILPFILIKSGLLNIKAIEVDNSQVNCFNETQIKDSSKLIGKNFFLVDLVKAEGNLKKDFYCIKSVIFNKSFPDKIKLQVFSRQPSVKLIKLKEKEASLSSLIENIATPEAFQIEDSYILDNEGVVFSKEMIDGNLPKIYISDLTIFLGKKFANDQIADILKILEKIKIFGVEVREGYIKNDVLVILAQPSGEKIIFRLNEKIDMQLASLQLILAEAKIDSRELEFIDLRFDKPIVKYTPIKK